MGETGVGCQSALYTLGGETVTEELLRTVLTEVEEVLNAKRLGNVSSDVSNLDPVTPNLLMA